MHKSLKNKFIFLLSQLFICYTLAALVNPQPGDNLWHLTAAIGTELDELVACIHIPLIVPSTGTTISVPGVYCLTSDVNLDPGVAGILTTTDNVFIDLNNHTISGGDVAIITNTTNINFSLENLFSFSFITTTSSLTIKNGVLKDQTGASIGIFGVNNSIVENVKVINPATFGIFGFESPNVSIKDVIVDTVITNTNKLTIAGILLFDLSFENISSQTTFNFIGNTSIENCKIINNTATLDIFNNPKLTNGLGIGIAGFNTVQIKDCVCTGYLIGFVPALCNNVIFDSCSASLNLFFGFFSFINAGLQFLNCQSFLNGDGFTIADCFSVFIENCNSNLNFANGYTIAFTNFLEIPFFKPFENFEKNSISLVNCKAKSNQNDGFDIISTATTVSYYLSNCLSILNTNTGFLFTAPNGIIENCVAQNNNFGFVLSDVANSSFFGFDSTTTANNCILKNCCANNNKVNGFMLSDVQNCLLTECQSSNNQIGFDISSVTGPCTIEQCVATSNTIYGFLGTNTNTAIFYLDNGIANAIDDFFHIDPTSAPISEIVSMCRMYGDNLSLIGGVIC